MAFAATSLQGPLARETGATLADRLAETLSRTEFSYEDRAFIEARPMFFLATADAEGRPDC